MLCWAAIIHLAEYALANPMIGMASAAGGYFMPPPAITGGAMKAAIALSEMQHRCVGLRWRPSGGVLVGGGRSADRERACRQRADRRACPPTALTDCGCSHPHSVHPAARRQEMCLQFDALQGGRAIYPDYYAEVGA